MRQFIFGAACGLSAALIVLPTVGSAASKESYRALDFMADAIERVNHDYIHEVSVQELAEKAVNGMLKTLDAHSSYVNAQELKDMKAGRPDNKAAGAGLSLHIKDGLLRVVSVVSGSPASESEIQPGDFLLAIDGELTSKMSLGDAIDKLRGPNESELKLMVRHYPGMKAQEIVIKRAVVNRGSDVMHERKGNLGYILIWNFGGHTADHLRDAVAALKAEIGPGIKGYIIDLRNNPGGLLDGAIAVADAMLNSGHIVALRGRNPVDNATYDAEAGDTTDGRPIVVLINEGSAAGAEIVAAALQDNHRATIMGMTSFGDGTIQTLIPIAEGGALKLTTAELFAPSGRPIQLDGVTPDIAISETAQNDASLDDHIIEAQLPNHIGSSGRTETATILYPTTDEAKGDFQLAKAVARLSAN